tara:strand:+ start:1812 stop:4787 length:2976 start_codon:yes stop_codon:yes gene_type:complete
LNPKLKSVAVCLSLNLIALPLFASDLKKVNIEGLSSNNINTIHSDSNGLLWIGTDQGLNRYDGLKNKVFRSNPFNTKSLSGNRIWYVENYNQDTLIVISDNAIHLFTPKNYTFKRYEIQSRPTSLYREGSDFWITTLDRGVYRFDSSKTLHHYRFDPLNPFSISTSEFKSQVGIKFASDSAGKIWLATDKGLCSIDKETNFVSRYFKSNTGGKLLSDKINTVFFHEEKLYIGTENGLNYLNSDNMKFSMEPELDGISIINFDIVNDELVIFTNNGVLKKNKDSITSFNKNSNHNLSLSTNTTLFWSQGEDKMYLNEDLVRLESRVQDVHLINKDNYLVSTENGIYNISSVKSGVTSTNKTLRITDNIKFKKLFNTNDFNLLNSKIKLDQIIDYEIIGNDIWYIYGGVVFLFRNGVIEEFEHNQRNPNSFPKEASSIKIFDADIWIGSIESGLFKYNIDDLTLIKHYQFDINNPNSLQTSIVTSLLADANNNFWIGSAGDGLFKYQEDIDGFTMYNESSGLKSGIINNLYSFDNKILISTKKGINFLSEGEETFKSLDSEDGLNLSENAQTQFYDINNQMYIENGSKVFKVNFDIVEKSISFTKPIVNSIVGFDSKNTEYLIEFSENIVSVPHYITTIIVNVALPSLYKANQNLYSYRYGNRNNSQFIIKKSGEPITISKRGYGARVLELASGKKENMSQTLSFNHIPPWYFSWAAIISYIVFVIGGIYLFTTIRAKKLQQQMEESRRSEELEEARNLQLQLLAKKVPDMKDVEVETYIRTATEVGGDYYDFFELDDGTLIAACGDATGHGATSGMMVSITKAGLKGIQKRSPDEMLTDLNNIVKSVEIGRIRMSLNLLEFKNGHVNISSAAMPPVYHFSKKKNVVNEIELVGTPLGSFYDEEFDKYQIDFEDGDALVLMSDGLPEAPNHDGEMLDYPAVKRCIKENGSKSASGIKDSLIELSDKWLDGIQNPDDITLVIFKKNKTGEIANA